jgi:hypothetical protein
MLFDTVSRPGTGSDDGLVMLIHLELILDDSRPKKCVLHLKCFDLYP